MAEPIRWAGCWSARQVVDLADPVLPAALARGIVLPASQPSQPNKLLDSCIVKCHIWTSIFCENDLIKDVSWKYYTSLMNLVKVLISNTIFVFEGSWVLRLQKFNFYISVIIGAWLFIFLLNSFNACDTNYSFLIDFLKKHVLFMHICYFL